MMLFLLGPVVWLACVLGIVALIVIVSFVAVFLGFEPKKP
jgi:hypothetical protein